MRTFIRGRAVGSRTGASRRSGTGRLRRAGRRLPDQEAARAALLRPAHPADPQRPSASATRRPATRIDPATGTALGNLDLTSFEGVQKRRDVLRTYGSYPQPLLLLKALPEDAVPIPYQGDTFYVSEIQHAGGKPIAANSDAYFELKRWLDNGANRDGIAPAGGADDGRRAAATPRCRRRAGASRSTRPRPAYQTFVADDRAAPARTRARTAPATARRRPTST